MNRISLAVLAGLASVAFSSAQAADLIIEDVPMVGIVEMGGDWDGVYVGGFVGWAVGDYDEDGGYTNDLDGWLAGVALGANFTLTEGIVGGVVGDIAWADIGFTDGGYDYGIDWVGSVRGRLGLDGGAFLPYLTAGLAVAGASGEAVASDSNVHVGWTVGAGVEFAVTDDMSVDLLYRYSDYGDQTYDVGFGDYEAGFNTHQVSVGVNFSF